MCLVVARPYHQGALTTLNTRTLLVSALLVPWEDLPFVLHDWGQVGHLWRGTPYPVAWCCSQEGPTPEKALVLRGVMPVGD